MIQTEKYVIVIDILCLLGEKYRYDLAVHLVRGVLDVLAYAFRGCACNPLEFCQRFMVEKRVNALAVVYRSFRQKCDVYPLGSKEKGCVNLVFPFLEVPVFIDFQPAFQLPVPRYKLPRFVAVLPAFVNIPDVLPARLRVRYTADCRALRPEIKSCVPF